MITLKKKQARVTTLSIGLMVLTSIHHLYGSILYNTPWRAHVLFLSVPVIVVNLIADRIVQKREDGSKTILFWANWLITGLFSVSAIGLYEGIYNHVLKNIFFFSGLSDEAMSKLFPPSVYEMPNDALFEATGIAQGFITAFLIVSFINLTKIITMKRNEINKE